MEWKTISDTKNTIDLIAELEKKNLLENNIILHIGTDAQTRGKTNKVDFVTVVCVHNVMQGAMVYYWRDKDVPTHSLWEKLYGETERSLRIAVMLNQYFKESLFDRILVHVDANPNPIYKSSTFVKTLAGMVMGYGFKHVLKPDAWAASHAADHIVKHKNDK
jgi:predicted RNase H-related nuclease YkuK (DUF458 family)